MADPDVEIGVDPRTGRDSLHRGDFARFAQGFADGEGADIRIARNAPIKLAQKFAAIAGVILPGIFAVENQRQSQRAARVHAFGDGADTAVEVLGGGDSVHAAVNEADQSRKDNDRERCRRFRVRRAGCAAAHRGDRHSRARRRHRGRSRCSRCGRARLRRWRTSESPVRRRWKARRSRPSLPTATARRAAPRRGARDRRGRERVARARLRDGGTPGSAAACRDWPAARYRYRKAAAESDDRTAWWRFRSGRRRCARRYSGKTRASSSSCFARSDCLSASVKSLPFFDNALTCGSVARYSSSIQASCESNCRSRQSRGAKVRLTRAGSAECARSKSSL